jgi:RNA polymerase sigma factor (sigma-70 family)
VNGDGPSDADLIGAVRAGDLSAYAVLFQRHTELARRVARRCGADATDQEDLVAEAFARVLTAIRSGAGPRDNLRPYLLVAVRNLALRAGRRDGRIDWYRGIMELEDVAIDATVAGSDEIVLQRWRSRLAWAAYLTLPPRWRTVLWHTEVNEATPSEIAPVLGLSPNGVSALATRAREGLRTAYLHVQIPDTGETCCRAARQRMASWIRGALPARHIQLITRHLTGCRDCQGVVIELLDIDRELRPPTGRRAARQRTHGPG